MKDQTKYDEMNKDISDMHKILDKELYKISKISFSYKWPSIESVMYN